MTAIETRYHGPTNFKGSRISVRWNKHRRVYSFPCELSGVDAHFAAVEQFLATLPADCIAHDFRSFHTFETFDGRGYVFAPHVIHGAKAFALDRRQLKRTAA